MQINTWKVTISKLLLIQYGQYLSNLHSTLTLSCWDHTVCAVCVSCFLSLILHSLNKCVSNVSWGPALDSGKHNWKGMCYFREFKTQLFPYHQELSITIISYGYILLSKRSVGVISFFVAQEEIIQLMRKKRENEEKVKGVRWKSRKPENEIEEKEEIQKGRNKE